MSLNQTSRHNNAFQVATFLAFKSIANDFERFIFARFKEATGVDDNRIGRFIFVDQLQSIIGQKSQHFFAIDQVLGTSQTDESHSFDCVTAH